MMSLGRAMLPEWFVGRQEVSAVSMLQLLLVCMSH